MSLSPAILLVSMIETPLALENVEEIARVPGLDMLLVGANDLSNALGLSGKTDRRAPGHEAPQDPPQAHQLGLAVPELTSRKFWSLTRPMLGA